MNDRRAVSRRLRVRGELPRSVYRTYPVVLAPLFGHMVVEQIFFMWQGMRRPGTLDGDERFTIAEIGAGDGALAESVLAYLERKAREDASWRAFAGQVRYIAYDPSPELNRVQQKRNTRFGVRPRRTPCGDEGEGRWPVTFTRSMSA